MLFLRPIYDNPPDWAEIERVLAEAKLSEPDAMGGADRIGACAEIGRFLSNG